MPDTMTQPIAIVGTSCRFPGEATSPSRLWELLKDPHDVASVPPSNRFDGSSFYHEDTNHPGTGNAREAYFLSTDPRYFDAPFFNISSAEASSTDPQQRQLLETVFESLEAAGMRIDQLQGSCTAVFCGQMGADWADLIAADFQAVAPHAATGNARSILANRISYFFDWHGPSVVVDTACSSSMVALHQAVVSLQQQECPVAIAAGTNLMLGPSNFITTTKMTMLSPDGRGRMWDARANGYARGEGIASVVLKRLCDAVADGDPIECVIRAIGVNQDGRTLGVTMPSSTAQLKLIEATYDRAGLDPRNPRDRCQYFEAHGTGTLAGDPQEASAIYHAFFGPPLDDSKEDQHDKGDVLHVGSIKTIVGHTEGMAGLAGIVKASLSIQNKVITPNMLFENLNPALQPYATHLRIPTKPIPWPAVAEGAPRRASVNSFGFGGTNAHAILESYEPLAFTNGVPHHPPVPAILPFTFSAAAVKSLPSVLETYERHLRENTDVNALDLASTMIQRRSALRYRLIITASTTAELIAEIRRMLEAAKINQAMPVVFERNPSKPKQLVAVFTGQGAQWPQMGHDIISQCPSAVQWMEEIQESLDQLPPKYRPTFSLLDELSNASANLHSAGLSQPLCTALQIVLVRFLSSLGIVFTAVVGHSSGEIAAAYAAGFLTAPDAIRIAYLRGISAAGASAKNGQRGAMMAAGLPINEAVELCESHEFKGRVVLAASNSPCSVTLSGDADAVYQLEQKLEEEKKFARVLRVDTAYHSHHMFTCVPAYKRAMEECGIQVQDGSTTTQWYSSVYPGVLMDLVAHESCLGCDYWIENMVSPVSFHEALHALVSEIGEPDVMIEVGPHAALQGPARQTLSAALPSESDVPYFGVLSRGTSGIETMAHAIGNIWGYLGPERLDITSYVHLFDPSRKLKLERGLPNYPFSYTKPYSCHKRLVNHHLFKRGPPNALLGTLDPTSGDGEWRWRNYIRQDILPWLSGHRIQSRTVFPATGYLAMALEAAGVIAGDRQMGLVKIEEFVINQAILLADDDPFGVEVLFRLCEVGENKVNRTTTGLFHIDACTGDSLQSRASGRLTVVWGQPETDCLASLGPVPLGMYPVNINDYYSFLATLGYEYSGAFKDIQSLVRGKDTAFGEISNRISLGHESSSPGPLLHPAVLDTALQVLLAALGAPEDGEIYTLLVPTRIGSVVINPAFCGRVGGPAAGSSLLATGATAKLDADGVSGDCDLFTQTGQGLVQMSGIEISPLQAAMEDRRLFAKLVWGPLSPDINWHLPDRSSELSQFFECLENVVLLYLKFTQEQLTEKDRKGLNWHRSTVVAWIDHVLTLTREGKHPILRREWLDGTRDDLDRLLQGKEHIAEAKMAAVVFANLVPFIRGEKLLLEEVRKDDVLTRFYEEGTGMSMMNTAIGKFVRQIAFRFPRMRILEIGAGTGSATRAVLGCIGRACHSYTFTDISVAFFEDAKVALADHEDIMIYQAMDIERDPIEQGFQEHSYDLVVASNVLHATKFMKPTMERVHRLLKPGGYLVMQEVTNLDTIATSFSVCGFEGWWTGHEDGRIWGPMLSTSAWEQLLRDTGFSGIDLYTNPADDERVSSTSVIVSQAVDDRLRLLREPMAPCDDPLTLLPHPTDLLILGSMLNWVRPLVAELLHLVGPRFSRVIYAPSLDSPDLINLSSTNRIVVLSLMDLWCSWFSDLTPDRLRSMQNLIRRADKMLWVTVGPEHASPHYGLSRGWLKSLAQENTQAFYQYLNIVNRTDATGPLLAETLMRLAYTDILNDFRMSTYVYTTEPELCFKDGTMQLIRLQDDPAGNDRYAAVRAHVTREVEIAKTCVSVVPRPGDQHIVRMVDPDDLQSSNPAAKYVRVRPRYSTSQSLPIDNGLFLHLVLGEHAVTGARLLCLSDQQTSAMQVPRLWTWEIPSGIPVAEEASLLKVAADTAVARFLLRQAHVNSTFLVHEAGDVFREVVGSQASDSSVTPFFTTSDASCSAEGVHILPAKASARVLKNLIPKDVSVAVCLSTEKDDAMMFAHIETALPPSAQHYTRARLYAPLTTGTKSNSPDLGQQLIDKLRKLSLSLVGWATREAPTEIISLREVSTRQLAHGCLIDWTQNTHVPAQISPAISLVKLSGHKTYLLAGMTGTFGQSIASWMVSKGARHIILASRTPRVDARWIEAMAKEGARMVSMTMDLINRDSVMTLYRHMQEHFPPIGGVVNGALVLEDSQFLHTTVDIIKRNMDVKVQGTLILDELSGPNVDLDFFIIFGSMTGIGGNWSQSAYSGATCFQANLIHGRRARGLVGSIIQMGVVNGIGIMARKGLDIIQHVRNTTGSYLLSERDVDRMFAEAIVAGRPDSRRNPEIINGLIPLRPVGNESLNWFEKPILWDFIEYCVNSGQDRSNRTKHSSSTKTQLDSAASLEQVSAIVNASLTDKIRSKFSLAPDYALTPATQLRDLGMDSLVAVDLRRWFAVELGVEIPLLDILDGGSIRMLTAQAVAALPAASIPNVTELPNGKV
ncbi:hypothetical protein BDW59DRAFT_36663 [Aspergillus cavernicola]|uniref:Polyketide synthase n=1 Tax=Aspergillus cavernicola TaxID=176166 RepID=A0ABR4HBH2_9EURO